MSGPKLPPDNIWDLAVLINHDWGGGGGGGEEGIWGGGQRLQAGWRKQTIIINYEEKKEKKTFLPFPAVDQKTSSSEASAVSLNIYYVDNVIHGNW